MWRALGRVFEPPRFGMRVDGAAHGGVGTENIHSPGPRSFLVLGCGKGWGGTSTGGRSPPWKSQGMETGCSQGSSRPSAEGFGATQLSLVVISAGQRVLHHRHHLPVQHGGAVAAAPAGPGCLPQRRRLAPLWFHSRTSLLQLKVGATQTEPAGSVPAQEPSPWGQVEAGGGTGLPPAPQSCWFSLSSVLGAVLCPGLHFLLE